jgi:phosphoglycerate kinase
MITNIKEFATQNPEGLKGKKVLVRVDFNVPVSGDTVVDDYRIVRALPTIHFLKDAGAKVLLISHIETKDVDIPTLKPAYEYLSKQFPLSFVEDILGDEAKGKIDALQDGEVILFENIRRYPGEKKNDPEFAKSLAGLADLYINDAFAVSHRAHASVVGVPQFVQGFAGLLLADEIKHLDVGDAKHPFLFILGGAKFETKLPLIDKFLDKADKMFIGGALANDLLRLKGIDVKNSLVSESVASGAISLDHLLNNPKVMVPEDLVWENDAIMDAGPKDIERLTENVKNAKYILWNGPLGNYEKGFKEGTIALSKLIGASDAESVVGGGDTLASIKELNLMDEFTFISTGGGAMLEFLLKGTLVGIQALDR